MLPKLRRVRRGCSLTPNSIKSLPTEADIERRHSSPTLSTMDPSLSTTVQRKVVASSAQSSLPRKVTSSNMAMEESSSYTDEKQLIVYREQSLNESSSMSHASQMSELACYAVDRQGANKEGKSLVCERPSSRPVPCFVEEIQPSHPDEPMVVALSAALEERQDLREVCRVEESDNSSVDYEPIALESPFASQEMPSLLRAPYTSAQEDAVLVELSCDVPNVSMLRKASGAVEYRPTNYPDRGFDSKSLMDVQDIPSLLEGKFFVEEIHAPAMHDNSRKVFELSAERPVMSMKRKSPCNLVAIHAHSNDERLEDCEEFCFEGRRFHCINC